MSDITLNRYLIEGTNAQRLLFTPDPTDQSTIGPGLFSLPIWYETDTGDIYIWDQNGTAWVLVVSGGGSGITQLTGDVIATGPGSVAATIANAAVTLAKIANAAANSKWLGSGAAGSGAAYTENSFGNGLEVSGTTAQMTANQRLKPISAVFDGGGSVIANGKTVYAVYVPYACTITAVTMAADQSGSIILDIKKCAHGSFPGSLTSIVASAPPTLSSAQQSQDTTLTGWTTSVSAGDILQFIVNGAPTSVTWVQCALTVSVG